MAWLRTPVTAARSLWPGGDGQPGQGKARSQHPGEDGVHPRPVRGRHPAQEVGLRQGREEGAVLRGRPVLCEQRPPDGAQDGEIGLPLGAELALQAPAQAGGGGRRGPAGGDRQAEVAPFDHRRHDEAAELRHVHHVDEDPFPLGLGGHHSVDRLVVGGADRQPGAGQVAGGEGTLPRSTRGSSARARPRDGAPAPPGAPGPGRKQAASLRAATWPPPTSTTRRSASSRNAG